MKPLSRVQLLADILAPEQVTTIVDIGANPFTGLPPYALLRRSRRCQVVGFEPQADILATLNQQKRENEIYLPYAVGNGETETLYLTNNSGLVSILPVEPWVGDYLNAWWKKATQLRGTARVDTRRLDDIAEINRIDFLKIDIQGGELKAFQHGRAKLAATAMIQTEVAILPYYQGQPSFGEIQSELGRQGFIAHRIVSSGIHQLGVPRDLARGLALPKSQATVADVVFLRNPIDMSALATETIKHMALLGDSVLNAFDLVLRCLGELVARRTLTDARVRPYLQALSEKLKPKPQPSAE